ncbi:hypothetical protein N0V88_005684 [Collariella sp. IMI 366227]|nr:hypothetical protein N0V88_005684 [Collariella sp. IMI 366227]
MRFLCLHGLGSNSDILEAQLAPIRAHLGPEHEFLYVDGFIECEPAPGMDGVFPPPYYGYFSTPTRDQLLAACEFVEQVVEEEGPFDGVVGYSQGAGLVATLLLRRKRMAAPDLFKLAVFGSLPDLFKPGKRYYVFFDPRTGESGVKEDFSSEADQTETAVVKTMIDGQWIARLPPGDAFAGVFSLSDGQPRISIPTVHILGERDPFEPQSRDLAGLCQDAVVVPFEGGHELSRNNVFSKKAGQAISAAIFRVLFGC